MRVEFGGVDLRSEGFQRPDGSWWFFQSLEGWDSADTRHSSIEPVGMQGDYVTNVTYAPRGLVLRGVCLPGAVDPWETSNWLAGATDALDGQKKLLVHEPTPKFVMARRLGRLRHEPPHKDGYEFELNLHAEDPIKYSNVETPYALQIDGGKTDQYDEITVKNLGNALVYPSRIRVWGSGKPNIRLVRRDTKQAIILEKYPVGTDEYNLYPMTREAFYGPPAKQRRHYDFIARGTQWWQLKKDGVATPISLWRSDRNANPLKATVYVRSGWV